MTTTTKPSAEPESVTDQIQSLRNVFNVSGKEIEEPEPKGEQGIHTISP